METVTLRTEYDELISFEVEFQPEYLIYQERVYVNRNGIYECTGSTLEVK